LLIFLYLLPARFDPTGKARRQEKQIVKDCYQEVSLLIFPANYRQTGIFRAGRGFDQNFLRCIVDPINTVGEPFFLRPKNILHKHQVSTGTSSPLSYVRGKFFNKEKSELQRYKEKEREKERKRTDMDGTENGRID